MVEINVCVGSSCHLKGSYNVIQIFQQLIEQAGLHEQVAMKATFCMKQCQAGVSVALDGQEYSLLPENSRDFFNNVVTAKLKAS